MFTLSYVINFNFRQCFQISFLCAFLFFGSSSQKIRQSIFLEYEFNFKFLWQQPGLQYMMISICCCEKQRIMTFSTDCPHLHPTACMEMLEFSLPFNKHATRSSSELLQSHVKTLLLGNYICVTSHTKDSDQGNYVSSICGGGSKCHFHGSHLKIAVA